MPFTLNWNAAIGPAFLDAGTQSVGQTILRAIEATRIWTSANTNLGIVLLLFSIGLELSFRRLVAMRHMVFGIGAAEMLLIAVLIGGALMLFGWPLQSAAWLGLALAMSSTALVLPISGTQGPVGRAALAMLQLRDVTAGADLGEVLRGDLEPVGQALQELTSGRARTREVADL